MAKWEVFKHQGSRSATVMRASLSVRGVVTLNQVSYEALLQPEAIELLFDGEEQLIGLRPTSADVRHSYPVRKQGKNKSYLIGAKAFCNYYNIVLQETVAFDEVKIESGIMILDLNKVTPVTPRIRERHLAPKAQAQMSFTRPATAEDDIPF